MAQLPVARAQRVDPQMLDAILNGAPPVLPFNPPPMVELLPPIDWAPLTVRNVPMSFVLTGTHPAARLALPTCTPQGLLLL
jgi:hypothetical protein